MSIGGKSLHKKDWLQLGLLAGTAAAAGPLSSWLTSTMGGASLLGGGAAAADVAGGGMASAAELAAINSAMGAAPIAGLAPGKGLLGMLEPLQRANQFVQLAQGGMGGPPQAAGARPQPQFPVSGDGMDYLRRIYGGMR